MNIISFRRFVSFLSIIILIGLTGLPTSRSWLPGDLRVALAAGDPVIAAAGDIACDPSSSSFNGGNGTSGSCRQKYTSDLLVNGGFAAVLPLGDNQYYCGGYQAWLQSYDLSWGRVKSITRPSVGNHEYLTSGGTDCTGANSGAAGYFRYFGSAAGQQGRGYYSFNVGAWHLIALNSNCGDAGGCSSSSPQGQWLQADLAANRTLCTLAYWHIPLFSSGGRANSNSQSLWQILYNNNVEVVLNGHDHIYERFAPQAPSGAQDNTRGIREFIVGTGGSNHTSLASLAANSLVRNTDTFGILKVTLHPSSYDWQFVPEPGKTFTDSGSASCFGTGQPGITNTPVSPSPTSGPLPTPTNTLVPIGTQIDPGPTTLSTFSPIADSYVNESSPTTNYGASTQLRTDGSPLVRSYLRFNVQNLAGRVTRATLRVYASTSLSAGYDVRPVTDNTWSESTINYNNAPIFGNAVGSSRSVAAGSWANIDVTSLITGNGSYSLALVSSSTTALSLVSAEASANGPQLIVEAQSPTTTPNPTATRTSTFTATALPSATLTATRTATPTATLPPAATNTATNTPTASDTPAASDTPTDTPPPTAIDPNGTPTATFTPVEPPTNTPTLFDPPTDTPIPQPTDTATDTPIPAATATSGIATFAFTPAADSYVNSGSPTTNSGTSTQLRVDGSPLVRSYLRFNVQGLNGTVRRATLRVFANSGANSDCAANIVTDNTWTETGINYNNAPSMSGALGSSGSFAAGVWISMDVTAYITGDGTYSIALTTPGSTAVSLASREAGANAPQLIIETGP